MLTGSIKLACLYAFWNFSTIATLSVLSMHLSQWIRTYRDILTIEPVQKFALHVRSKQWSANYYTLLDVLHSCLLHRRCNFLKFCALFACLLDQCHSLLLLCLSQSHPTLVDILMPCKCGFLILNPIYIKTHFLLTWLRHGMIFLMTCLL